MPIRVLARRVLAPYWIFPLVAGAALVLAYLGYRAARRLATLGEESHIESNEVVGDKLIDGIERSIIDTDQTFFTLFNLDSSRELVQTWNRIVAWTSIVESAIVLDPEGNVLHFFPTTVSDRARRLRAERFRTLFQNAVLHELDLAHLGVGQHRHLHRRLDGNYYLFSYTQRQQGGRSYFVVLSVSLEDLKTRVFPEQFKGALEYRQIAVVDESERVVWGNHIPRDDRGPFLFEKRFPTTLYNWRLQMVPRNVQTLIQQTKTRRFSDLMFIGFSLSVVLVGITLLSLSIRKERRVSELKSDFISNVSHELKTPLSLIRMFSELLALGQARDPETLRQYAEIITREGERLSRLIDNVLDLARIERGKQAYEFHDGDLAAVVEHSLDVFRHRMEREQIALRAEVPADLPALRLDGSAMTLLVLNLLENAVKYGAERGGEVGVRVAPADGHVVLQVSDQGSGIHPDDLKRIFERFYRARDARSNKVRGSGIGLALVKEIAEAHGGRVSVESVLGKGSTFTVTLPVAASEASGSRAVQDKQGAHGAHQEREP